MAWELFDRDGAAGFQICGVDGGALADAPIVALPIACEITVSAESATPVALEATERDLERVTETLAGRIVATARTRTSLITLAYLADDDGADRYSKVTLPRGASISVAPAIDPEWTLFAAASPVDIEQQSMLDFRVRQQLHAQDDVGGERAVEHVVLGLTEDTVDDFMTSLFVAFDDLRGDADADGDEDVGHWRVTHVADPKDITESSWMIRQIAERHGADYDGWGCSVVTARPPERKRRWFR